MRNYLRVASLLILQLRGHTERSKVCLYAIVNLTDYLSNFLNNAAQHN